MLKLDSRLDWHLISASYVSFLFVFSFSCRIELVSVEWCVKFHSQLDWHLTSASYVFVFVFQLWL